MNDNPNPRASIALICHYPFFIDVNFSVYENLLPDIEFIYDPMTIGQKPVPEEKRQLFKKMLNDRGVYWRDFESTTLTPNEFFSKYHTLVGNLYEGSMRHPVNATKRKVRVFYGVAKDLWMYALWNAHFDLICTPGEPFSQKISSLYPTSRVVTTGEPKFDSGILTNKELVKHSFGLASGKKVLLVAATWGQLSSLEKLLSHLIKLSERYEVIIKPHHVVATFEPETLEIFAGTPIKIIDYLTPVPTAIGMADVVISDSSGAIFDALILDKPLVLIDQIGPSNTEFFTDKPFYGLVGNNRLTGAATSFNSEEQKIKRPGEELAPVVSLYKNRTHQEHHVEFLNAIQAANNKFYRSRQRKYVAENFVTADSSAGKRIAEAVKQLINDVGRGIIQNKLMSDLVNDFEVRLSKQGENWQSRKIADLEDRLSVFSKLKQLPFSEKLRFFMRNF